MEHAVEEKITRDWATEINDKYTFFGVLVGYYPMVSKYWKDLNTQITYMSEYDRYLLEEVNGKPLEDYSRADFDQALVNVQKKLKQAGMVYHDERIQHFRVLIRRVTKAADEAGICDDILWGTNYLDRQSGEDSQATLEARKRRSLTEKEEMEVASRVMVNSRQQGQRMGLALLFCFGLRNNEACGADFGDIRPMVTHPGCYTLRTYKSTMRNSRERQDGGKTGNAGRIIPVPEKMLAFLRERRAWIREEMLSGRYVIEGVKISEKTVDAVIDRLPIVCEGDDFAVGCSSHHLTVAGKHLFHKEIKLDEGLVRQIDSDLQSVDKADEACIEKEATTYLLRRNFATRLYQLGLTETEIQYIIGHDIEDEDEERSYYRNEEKLYPIYEKMSRRFLVNDSSVPTIKVNDEYNVFENQSHTIFHFSGNKTKRVKLCICSNDADSDLRIKMNVHKGKLSAHLEQRPNASKTRDEVNITELARKRYTTAIEQVLGEL